MSIINRWMYLGCRNGSGHYLFGGDGLPYDLRRRLECMDGKLAPQPESDKLLYRAALSRLGGMGISALSWWDRSVDSRGGSNSIVFAPGLDIAPAAILTEGQQRFPWVFSRLPKPVELLSQ